MRTYTFVVMLLAVAACGKRAEAPAANAQKTQEAAPHAESATDWTAKTELFMEYSPLIAGQTSRFAIHLTRLDNFKPVAQGKVEVELRREGAAPEVFSTDGPSRPGIFGVDVKPSGAGDYRATVRLSGSAISDSHEVGTVTVQATKTAGTHEHGAEIPDVVAFLKEQQWTLDFATAIVEDRNLRNSLRVPGEVSARSGGEAEVTVPFDGRLVAVRLPVIGERVAQGQILAGLLPPTSTPADVASLDLARNESRIALQLARKDRERAERLVSNGAAPAKRLDEARTVEATAEARLQAAEARLAQFDASIAAELNPKGAKLFALRSPISGIVQQTSAAPGANVRSGSVLFRIVDADRVYVSAAVPESELPAMSSLSGAEAEIPGLERPRALNKLISIGRVVDPQSRTFPVVYEVDNRDRRIAINQALQINLLTRSSGPAPAVPESAVIDDAGRPVIFIQIAGEAFQKRFVRLGMRQDGFVQVLDGVLPGGRVVTKGAHLIRLASMSSQVPAHGHVH